MFVTDKHCFLGQTLTIERLQSFGRKTLFVTFIAQKGVFQSICRVNVKNTGSRPGSSYSRAKNSVYRALGTHYTLGLSYACTITISMIFKNKLVLNF